MTEPHAVVIARLSANFAALSRQFVQVSSDLVELERVLSGRPGPLPAQEPQAAPVSQAAASAPPPAAPPPTVPPAAPPWPGFAPVAAARRPGFPSLPTPPYWPHYPLTNPYPAAAPIPPAARTPAPPRSQGWIGKLLAVAGVAVTLIGVALLLVLAAQAGLLRPEFRVGAGAVLAAALVGAGWWLNTRPGGRVGAVSLAATGIAAAYIDVIAVTTIYGWVSAPVGLVVAAIVAGTGLTLARWWDSQHLGLLVLVPLIALAPVVTDGITLLLVGFLLALAAVSLPVQLGKDWIWLHAARITAASFPLLVALVVRYIDARDDLWLAGGCAIAALIAVGSALILLPGTSHRAAMAVLTAAGVLPVLAVGLAVDRVLAALMAAAVSAAMLAIVLAGDRLPGVPGAAKQVFSALSAVAALIAVTVAFDGRVAGPVLLALAVVVAVAGRHDTTARWAAFGFTIVGAGVHLSYSPLYTLLEPVKTGAAAGVSTLVSSVLLAASAVAVLWSWRSREAALWVVAGGVVVYSVTSFTVTAGTMIAGDSAGFYGGHMVATICWIVLAAALFGYAARRSRAERSVPIGAGLALVAAAVAKLFLFDLGTLDGIFRVVVFIVVGLILLGMGAGYARLLDKQDRQDHENAVDVTTDTG